MTSKSNNKHYTFILYHAGETNGLRSIMIFLINSGLNITIIPVGETANNILESNEELKRATHAPRGLINKHYGSNTKHDTSIDETELTEICQMTDEADYVIVGTPSRIQLQIIKKLNKSKHIVAFFDAFIYKPKKVSLFSLHCHTLLVTSKQIGTKVRKQLKKSDIRVPVHVIGHGDIDTWKKISTSTSKPIACQKMHIEPAPPLLLWCGGYGEIESLSLTNFAPIIKDLVDHSICQFRVKAHPGIASDKEKCTKTYEIPLREAGFMPKNILINKLDITTCEVVIAAYVTFSAGSTTTALSPLVGTYSGTFTPRHNGAKRQRLDGLTDNLCCDSSSPRITKQRVISLFKNMTPFKIASDADTPSSSETFIKLFK